MDNLLTEKELQLLGQQYEEADHSCGGVSLNEYLLNAQHNKTLARAREAVKGAGLTPKEIGDNLDLEVEAKYPCSDGSTTWTISVDKLLKAQLQAILKAIRSK